MDGFRKLIALCVEEEVDIWSGELLIMAANNYMYMYTNNDV